jgi:hypothetical protein
MRLKLALLTTALAFGLGTPAALAEDAPEVNSDITIAGAPADEAPATKQDEEDQGAPDEDGAAAPNSGDSETSEMPPASE